MACLWISWVAKCWFSLKTKFMLLYASTLVPFLCVTAAAAKCRACVASKWKDNSVLLYAKIATPLGYGKCEIYPLQGTNYTILFSLYPPVVRCTERITPLLSMYLEPKTIRISLIYCTFIFRMMSSCFRNKLLAFTHVQLDNRLSNEVWHVRFCSINASSNTHAH